MSSFFKEADNCSSFTPKTPRFYRIIHEEVHVIEKLPIPRRFMRKHGKDISSTVVLVDQACGLKWQVGLSYCDEKFWLDNGWSEFAKHSSLGYGSFLLFEYKGSSQFSITVFDKYSTTVDHPACLLNNDPPGSAHPQNHESYKSMVLFSPSEPEADNLHTNHPLDDIGQDQVHEVHAPAPIPAAKPKPVKKMAMRSFRPGIRRSSRAKGQEHASKKLDQSGSNAGSSKAEQAASHFTSKYPYFKVVLHPCQLVSNLTIPQKFVMDHIKPRMEHPKQRVNKLPEAKLLAGDGKWSVKLNVYFRYNGQGKLSAGWPQFAYDNGLEVGDVCVFELINNDPVIMKVSIFKQNG